MGVDQHQGNLQLHNLFTYHMKAFTEHAQMIGLQWLAVLTVLGKPSFTYGAPAAGNYMQNNLKLNWKSLMETRFLIFPVVFPDSQVLVDYIFQIHQCSYFTKCTF